MTGSRLEILVNGKRRRVTLPATGRTLIGRAGRHPANDIELTDPSASRSHAELRAEADGSYILSDSGSLKGTFVNDSPITRPRRLHDGDRLLIGATECVFHTAADDGTQAHAGEPTMLSFDSRWVTVVVFDIRGSTGLGQRVDAATLAAAFGAFNEAAVGIMQAHGAWHPKFTGDGLAALWPRDTDRLRRADLARVLACLLALGDRLTEISTARLGAAANWGAGINTGQAQLGNMGGRGAQDFMPVSDTVNRAFRLEAATKATGATIVADRSCFDLLDPPMAAPAGVTVTLNGYSAPALVHPLDTAAAAALVTALSGAA